MPLFSRACVLLSLATAAACTQTGEDPPPAAPPVVTVPANTYVGGGTTFALTAQATDPNGDALTFAWTQLTGSPVTITGANTATLSVTVPSIRGDLAFRVTVTDATGAATTADANLWVRINTDGGPLPLRAGRTFRYQVREQVYDWVRDSEYLDPLAPVDVGTATLNVGQPQPHNGLQVWPLELTDATNPVDPMAGAACSPGSDDTVCGSPNLACVDGTCQSNKPLRSTANILQVDGQILLWVDENTAAIPVVDPSRMVGLPYLYDGHELFSGRTRVMPQPPDTPIRFIGDTALGMVMPPAAFVHDTTSPCVEVFDGTRNKSVLSPYRTTRTFYEQGVGITYFQWESVPRGFDAAGKVGFRDAILVETSAP
jgi:hypothetical protein